MLLPTFCFLWALYLYVLRIIIVRGPGSRPKAHTVPSPESHGMSSSIYRNQGTHTMHRKARRRRSERDNTSKQTGMPRASMYMYVVEHLPMCCKRNRESTTYIRVRIRAPQSKQARIICFVHLFFRFCFHFFFPVLFLVSLSLRKYIRTYVALLFILSNGQNRVHPEARWPKPGTPLHASPRAPSYWPTPAQTRLWPNFKRVHPILATHSPIGYPISITPTRLWPGYSTSSPHAHAHTSSRHRGTRRGISAVDVVVRAAEL